MQIITREDKEYNEILEAFKEAKLIGQYWHKEKLLHVKAATQYMLIAHAEKIDKIALKPALTLEQAIELARQYLVREEEQGKKVKYEDSE